MKPTYLKKLVSLAFYSLFMLAQGPSLYAQNAPNAAADNGPRLIVHLLSYLSQDYGEAVQAGKVVSQFEYDEQGEFANRVVELTNQSFADQAELKDRAQALKQLVADKGEHSALKTMAGELKQKVIELSKLTMAPGTWPKLKNGQVLFAQNCVTCHGAEGRGDGPGAPGLEPAPANFHDADRMPQLSPFALYNTITLGVEGTAMAPYDQLSEQDRWDLAFYIAAMRHQGQTKNVFKQKQLLAEHKLDLAQVAELSDSALKERLVQQQTQNPDQVVAAVRSLDPQDSYEQFLVLATTKIDNSFSNYNEGKLAEAQQAALEAYLNGIEPVEGLLSVKNPELLQKVEQLFAGYRMMLKDQVPSTELQFQVTQIKAVVGDVQRYLSSEGNNNFGQWLVFGIVLREALEALLIIATILAALRMMAPKAAQLWVHAGWVSAVGLGVMFWFLFDGLLSFSGMAAENVEGVASIGAVAVLLYVGFWFHRQSEIEVWKSYVKDQLQQALSHKKLFSIAGISFLAVFREALETVLFLKTVAISNPELSSMHMLLGTLSAIAVALVLGFVFLKVSRKVPLRLVFKLSTAMVFMLAVMLTGKGIHVFQQTGLLPETFIGSHVQIESLGIFPFWESLAAQLVVVILALFIMNRAKFATQTQH